MRLTATTDTLRFRFISTLADVDAAAWNALAGNDYPFLRHEFLLALEQTGCTTAKTGWLPQHLLVETADQTLVALLPLYAK
jgi:predicted N-acyltransferase